MSLAASLSKQVGPMPLGAWLVVGAGGLFIAYKTRTAPDAPAATAGDPLPTGGGYGGGGAGAIDSYDGAAVVLSPVFQLPAPTVNVNVATPTPTKAPTPAPKPAPAPPRVPSPVKTKPKPAAPKVTSYTIKGGDTLWSIAGKVLGNPTRWPAIYAQNKATIENEAHRHGRRNSSNGHWIYPGTVLRITK